MNYKRYNYPVPEILAMQFMKASVEIWCKPEIDPESVKRLDIFTNATETPDNN